MKLILYYRHIIEGFESCFQKICYLEKYLIKILLSI